MSNQKMKGLAKELKTQFTIIGIFIAIFWIIEIVNQMFFGDHLDYFGIIPRSAIGLRGIILAPFLHVDFPHLIANTLPFAVLGWLVMLQETSDFYIVSLCSILVSGIGVWLFAQTNSITVGASGVIFGYFGFLIMRSYFQKNTRSIAISLLVFFLYGGMIWGVLPSNPHVSWLAHLFGFLGGVLAAKLIAKEKSV
ncbi:MAG: rhomboid family intramembrane serine protease [Cyanobacteria bacterium]|nr:rhomboid family intramembrane serine protease [Cyanobacteria bacterium CG_2015-16_32_12]NCO79066.1 rhomboid family intramembrane serine protease [Cyanobacteria bacterium CG_2015-22_32_23]NCQ05218.1 rhomboid family intramembrane serine protease [Cyanobacteria bacterium CG_2015-09_32_10]NCQ42396.1 rhomboid family intramembrane serine protease [Cyanobacteria bacterium CG_2015-04_32_10]NCS86008.1 rhomboid family intramembrane serine protease [Cyanobacteria bacterium CG_2015-02_32_10]